MQPLISPVDHESRHNSHRTEEIEEPRVSEDTPLLHRFPNVISNRRSHVTTIVVTLLLIILVSGVIIGIYLLILQSRSENILPPVDIPLQMVSRSQWDRDGVPAPTLEMSARTASQVIVVQTDTGECYSTPSCTQLLHNIQDSNATGQAALAYNFLVSSNGQTYEGLGWHRLSTLFPEHSASSLVLAFIGNYSRTPPTRAQLVEAKNFVAESISHQYLQPSYKIFGKSTRETPTCLFSNIAQFPHWKKKLSDPYVESINCVVSI